MPDQRPSEGFLARGTASISLEDSTPIRPDLLLESDE